MSHSNYFLASLPLTRELSAALAQPHAFTSPAALVRALRGCCSHSVPARERTLSANGHGSSRTQYSVHMRSDRSVSAVALTDRPARILIFPPSKSRTAPATRRIDPESRLATPRPRWGRRCARDGRAGGMLPGDQSTTAYSNQRATTASEPPEPFKPLAGIQL
jgi:hypothetical protein